MKQKYLLLSIILSVFLILLFTTSLALIPGDFGGTNNGPSDGVVNFEDLMIFAMVYSSTPSDFNWNPICDIAGPDGKITPDGVIDFEDLMIFSMHYGEYAEDTPLSPITLSDSITFDGKIVINGGEHTITVKFVVPVASVRVFITNYSAKEDGIRNFAGIPSDVIEVAMTTADGKTYIGIADFGWGNCNEEWIYVLSGESCCPVVYSRTVLVDDEAPRVGLVAEMESCDIGECPQYDTDYKIVISTQTDDPECDPACCGDTCTTVAEWSIEIFNYYDGYGVEVQPYDDCCERQDVPACDIVDVVTGDVCNISYTGLCVADTDWIKTDYKVIVTLADIVGNTRIYDGILSIDTTSGVTATIDDASLSDDCQRWTDANDDGVLGYNCFPLAEKY